MRWRKAALKAIKELDEYLANPLTKNEKDAEYVKQQLLCLYRMAHDAGDQVAKQRVLSVVDERYGGKKVSC